MNLDLNHLFGTAVFFGLVLFFLYRRFRRNFGRQRLRRGRLQFRLWLLIALCLFLLPGIVYSALLALACLVGGAIGVSLGIWGAKHTRFEQQDGTLYYIPHTYAGMAVSALFLGRLLYRFVIPLFTGTSLISASLQSAPGDFSYSAFSHNPVTRAIFFILAGYYIYYYWYVLHESEHLKPEDWEKPAPPPSAPTTGGNIK